MAHTDPLTGLSNRRQFESILHAELAALRRYGGHCAMAMIDVDFFKQYNDAHGHVAGDELLKTLADVMRSQIRSTDLLARYGGEEFGLIMSQTPKAEALRTVERLRAVVEAYSFKDAQTQPGAASPSARAWRPLRRRRRRRQHHPPLGRRPMYAAKRNGRNRVESA
jgi:diguanylate cyclase (GGDEF)-like protein